jgi:hypothetical protein
LSVNSRAKDPSGTREIAADYSLMDREVNDARTPGSTPTRWEDHSFLAATPRGGSSDALKMSTALR